MTTPISKFLNSLKYIKDSIFQTQPSEYPQADPPVFDADTLIANTNQSFNPADYSNTNDCQYILFVLAQAVKDMATNYKTVIAWTNFSFFVRTFDFVSCWVPSDQQNGADYTGDYGIQPSSYGLVQFTVPEEKIYRFTISFKQQNNHGIAKFLIDSLPSVDIDMYELSPGVGSYTWTQLLSAGQHTIALDSDKNIASTGYWLVFCGDGLTIS